VVIEKVAKLLGRRFGVPVVSIISARPVEAIMFLVVCLFVCLFVCNITGERVQLSSYTFRIDRRRMVLGLFRPILGQNPQH